MKKLRVTFITANAPMDLYGPNGGLEMALIESGKALVEKGHSVNLVADFRHGSGNYAGMRLVGIQDWLGSESANLDAKSDIVAISSGSGADILKRLPADVKKVILHHHGIPEHLGGPEWAESINRYADAVICVSNAVKGNLLRNGVVLDKLHVVHNGVDHSIFYPRKVERDMKRIMFVGALVPDKNPELLLQAFISLRAQQQAATLHFYGSAKLWGMERELLNVDAIRQEIPNTFFHGIVDQENLAIAYSQAAICVNPSWYESFSLVSIEAQACGCVPVLARVGGMTETVLENKTGFLFEQGNAQDLEDILNRLLSEPEILKKTSTAAMEFVKRQFSWDKVADQYEKIFNEMLSRPVDHI